VLEFYFIKIKCIYLGHNHAIRVKSGILFGLTCSFCFKFLLRMWKRLFPVYPEYADKDLFLYTHCVSMLALLDSLISFSPALAGPNPNLLEFACIEWILNV